MYGDGGSARWSRHETLTLLEIRLRLDPKFKEADQKGPLWEEISRIMSEEHGYQRSSKKCREKFENLYKYYKKTKVGKSGRQDGKHYRFFRQLEALCNDGTNSPPSFQYNHHQAEPYYPQIMSLLNSFNLDSTSSDYNNDAKNKEIRKGKARVLKSRLSSFIDAQLREVMDRQDAWMKKMVRTIEAKEQERMEREEQWRKHDAARIEKEHRDWEGQRAWIETRDAALMDAFNNLIRNQLRTNNQVPLGSVDSFLNTKVDNSGDGCVYYPNPNQETFSHQGGELFSSWDGSQGNGINDVTFLGMDD